MHNSNHMSISYRLPVIATQFFFSYLLSLKNFKTPLPHPYPGQDDFSQNQITLSLGQKEGSHQKTEFIAYILFEIFCYQTDRHCNRQTDIQEYHEKPWGFN